MEQRWFDANRARWDERVPIHVTGPFYDVEGFKAGQSTLRDFEVAELPDVEGLELVHLQCHFGLDTLSWARRGARVAGLDFSGPAIEAARAIADEVGLAAEFVEADVHDAVEAFGGRAFDAVYTGLGALNWLPDLHRWAGVVRGLLRPGGLLYLAEFHPFTHVFADDDLTVEHSYFHGPEPTRWVDGGTYADPDSATTHNESFEWNHPLGEVVSAVIEAGFRLEFLHEHDSTLFPRWPFLQLSGRDTYRLPEGTPSLPLMYSLRATLPPGDLG